MSDVPSVGVVLLNWKSAHDTAECLCSLQQSTYTNLHLIVVDNDSRDGGVEYLRAHFPDIEFIGSDANRGYAAGNNLGLARCLEIGSDYALLLNNDTVVAPNTVELLVQAAEQDARVGGVGAAIYCFDRPTRLWYVGARCPRWSPLPRTLTTLPADGRPFDVDIIAGAAMLIRGRWLRAVGLLDERYFMYYEDVEYCDRLRGRGARIWVAPEARVWHKVSRSTRRDVSLQRYYRARSRMFYYYHYPHGPGRLFTLSLMVLGDAKHLLIDLGQRHYAAVRARIRGLWEGWQLARAANVRR